jgi:hypothetical protein
MTAEFPVLVVSPDEVEKNIHSFIKAVESDGALQARLSNARAWYASKDQNGRWQFAPSKWAGYSNMTATQYVENARANMDGRQTENRLSQWFRALPPGSSEHRELLRELAAFTSRYGKQPSAACRIAIVHQFADYPSDGDELVSLIVRVAQGLSASQRGHIRDALRK